MMKIFNKFTAIIFLLVLLSTIYSNQLLIITHKDNSTKSLSSRDLRLIYLRKKSFWEQSQPIIPVLSKDVSAHLKFVKQKLYMEPMQFFRYINNAKYSGRKKPLQSFSSAGSVIEYVNKTPGSIGYILEDSELIKNFPIKILDIID